jgi:hypothetical protein
MTPKANDTGTSAPELGGIFFGTERCYNAGAAAIARGSWDRLAEPGPRPAL